VQRERAEAQLWTSIPALLVQRTASGYDEALLAELRELAEHQGQRATFDAKLAQVIAPSSSVFEGTMPALPGDL